MIHLNEMLHDSPTTQGKDSKSIFANHPSMNCMIHDYLQGSPSHQGKENPQGKGIRGVNDDLLDFHIVVKQARRMRKFKAFLSHFALYLCAFAIAWFGLIITN